MFLFIQVHFLVLNVSLLLRIVLLWLVMMLFKVFGSATANFDVISVENTVKFIIFWEIEFPTVHGKLEIVFRPFHKRSNDSACAKHR